METLLPGVLFSSTCPDSPFPSLWTRGWGERGRGDLLSKSLSLPRLFPLLGCATGEEHGAEEEVEKKRREEDRSGLECNHFPLLPRSFSNPESGRGRRLAHCQVLRAAFGVPPLEPGGLGLASQL